MINLSKKLDTQTNFPDTWKTLVRELLLKFEDGCTYTHKNIAGNRPYTVELKITIDEPVDDETYDKLHKEAEEVHVEDEEIREMYKELILKLDEAFNDDDPKVLLEKILNSLK